MKIVSKHYCQYTVDDILELIRADLAGKDMTVPAGEHPRVSQVEGKETWTIEAISTGLQVVKQLGQGQAEAVYDRRVSRTRKDGKPWGKGGPPKGQPRQQESREVAAPNVDPLADMSGG